MAYIDERLFFAGLNTDEEDRGLAQGDYRYAKNIEITSFMNEAEGVMEKAYGNREVSVSLPAGPNKCIGSVALNDDDGRDRVYYFIWNAAGNHGIYEYVRSLGVVYEVMVDPVLNFKTNHRIDHANIVDGKLLYWTDGENPPRKININKAKSFGKRRKYRIDFGPNVLIGETYSFAILSPAGAVVEFVNVTVPATGGTAFDLSKYIAANATSNFATFTSCGPNVEVELLPLGQYTLTASASIGAFPPVVLPNQAIAVADNFYPQPYIEDFIDRLKYPPNCNPKAVYKYDSNRSVSLVTERVFQFAVRYIYDDNEKSTLSPYSLIPAYNDGCTATASAGNYIEVDFTDTRINDPSSRSIIKGIDICFREHNDGIWKIAQTLEPYQFGIGQNIFKFYNDQVYAALSDEESVKLYDSVPIKSSCQEYIGNRIFDGDITENYDQVCVDANINVGYINDPVAQQGFTIRGLLSVLINTRQDHRNYSPLDRLYREPIYRFEQATNSVSKTGYGLNLFWGGALAGNGWWPGNNYHFFMGIDDWGQYIALGGFVVYLAGTDYYGTSKQRIIPGYPGFQDPNTGAVVIDANRQGAGNGREWLDILDIINYKASGGDFVSDWEINGVLPGKYVLRVASHYTTGADLIAGKDVYQKSSSTIMYGAFQGQQLGVCNTGQFEAIVEVLNNGTVNIYDPTSNAIIASNATGFCGEIFVADPAYCKSRRNNAQLAGLYGGMAYVGYNIDGAGAPVPATSQGALAETRIANSQISTYTRGYSQLQPANTDEVGWAPVDHNGFFWIASELGDRMVIDRFTIGTQAYTNPATAANPATATNATLQNYSVYSETAYPAAYSAIGGHGGIRLICRLNDITTTNNRRTHIKGKVVDQFGNPVEGVNASLVRNAFDTTDALGEFDIITYLDAGSAFNADRILLISSSNYACSFSISGNTFAIFPDIGTAPGFFNNANPFVFSANIVITVALLTRGSSFKRGFDGTFGIVYYDRGNRSTTVNTIEPLQIHIPYYTEKDPVTGTIPTALLPVLSWTINNQPPDWATHYQWVRTKNMQSAFFLEWCIDEVEYTNEPLSTAPAVPANTARFVKIGYDNLIYYASQNPDSILAYTWQAGDRLRFRADQNGNLLTQYLDYKIEAVDGGFMFIENNSLLQSLTSGTLIEMYRGNLQTEEKLYYEFGECYDVYELNGEKYHRGPVQDQNSTQGAQGIFQSGDVWYRRRAMPYDTTAAPQQIIAFVSDRAISDFYDSFDEDIGRINIENKDSKQIRRERSVRFSSPYVLESFINGLSSFNELDVDTLDKGEGPIFRLKRSGRVLLAIQPSTTNSLYINEVIYIDAAVTNTLTKSDKVIASKVPLTGLYGTVDPGSVVEFAGRVYYFDRNTASVIRYSADGLTPISNYKFKKGARDISQSMLAYPRVSTYAVGAFDPVLEKYFLTVLKRDPDIAFNQQTVAYSEPKNRWVSWYDFTQEQYEYVGQQMLSWDNGALYIHDNNDRANYNGTQYSAQIKAVSNMGADKIRNFLAISTESSDAFHCPVITVPLRGGQMQTRILPGRFRFVENVYYSPIPKDLNTPNATDPIVNGRDMRGHTIAITLQHDGPENVRMFATNVRFIASELSKQ